MHSKCLQQRVRTLRSVGQATMPARVTGLKRPSVLRRAQMPDEETMKRMMQDPGMQSQMKAMQEAMQKPEVQKQMQVHIAPYTASIIAA